jgi:hypothetical protein
VSYRSIAKPFALLALLVAAAGCARDIAAPLDSPASVSSIGSRTPALLFGMWPSISAGQIHTCGTRADGSVSCWAAYPASQAMPPADLAPVYKLSSDYYQTCALKTEGGVACWGPGDNYGGPTLVPEAIREQGVADIATATVGDLAKVCVVKMDGKVQCWGFDIWYLSSRLPEVPADLPVVSQIALSTHACAIRPDGTVVCWNQDGDWGYGAANVPAGLTSVIRLAVGQTHSCALKDNGTVVCWGDNNLGQTAVPAGLANVTSISAGDYHTCARSRGGAVACWGYGANPDDPSVGAKVPADLPPAASVSASGWRTCALLMDGGVRCWNLDGSLETNVPADINFGATRDDSDSEAPVVTVPGPITLEATSPSGTPFSFEPVATDDGGVVSVSCDAPAVFPIGTTIVTCTAVDEAGNSGSATFPVSVIDTQMPVLELPANLVVDASSASGAAVTFSASASDIADPDVAVTCGATSGTTFPIGVTTVTCTATDDFGNAATGSFTITVKSASAQVADFQQEVANLDLQEGTETSVQSKLSSALESLAANNVTAACGSLTALVNQVNAQIGKKITAADAQVIVATAERIRATSGCSNTGTAP